jgi:hypothetical protein
MLSPRNARNLSRRPRAMLFHDRGQFGPYSDRNCPRSWSLPGMLTLKSGHNAPRAGLLRRRRAASAALSQLAGTRAAPRTPSRSRGTDLTSSDPPKKGSQGSLKFLALRSSDLDGASMSSAQERIGAGPVTGVNCGANAAAEARIPGRMPAASSLTPKSHPRAFPSVTTHLRNHAFTRPPAAVTAQL